MASIVSLGGKKKAPWRIYKNVLLLINTNSEYLGNRVVVNSK